MNTMTQERSNPNISVVSHCAKCNTPAYAGSKCWKCGTQLPSNKPDVHRTQDLVQELVDKQRIAKGFMLLNLSETRDGDYEL